MKQGHLLLIPALAFMLFSCEAAGPDTTTPDGDGDGGGTSVTPISYENRQARSAKRGVSFNFSQTPAEDCALLGPAVSWSYNWGNSLPSSAIQSQFDKYGMEYIQMIWNGNFNPDNIRAYKAAHPEAEYILAFNEPNLTDQANMTPAEAATHWPAVKALAEELGMAIIAPAMNYGTLADYHDPWKWLDEFFTQPGVSLDDVSGIAIHCYMNSPKSVKGYIEEFKKYGKPIWLTEFCAWEGNVSEKQQIAYMSEMLNYLETADHIERYAWFIPRGNGNSQCHNSLLTTIDFNNRTIELTPLGKVFVNMSTFDETVYYKAGEIIPAEHYITVSDRIHLNPSSDPAGGILEVTDVNHGAWVEYLIELETPADFLEIRYTSFIDVNVSLYVDDEKVSDVLLENADSKWVTKTVAVSLPEGRHRLKIGSEEGYTATYNYFKIKTTNQ
ncbi:MAG: hypothetical protein IJ005_07135 [Bacteroidales bacterium]|nr:hypothetical protein [Bacteroidales bacterium]